MRLQRLVTQFIAILFLASLYFSCSKDKPGQPSGNSFNSLVTQISDSMNCNPAFAKDLSCKKQSETKDSFKINELRYLYASACFNLTQYDTTYRFASDVLRFCKRHPANDKINMLCARTHNLLANYYNNMYLQDSAAVHYNQALKYFQQQKDYNSIILLMINLADVYVGKGDYANGVRYYRQALFIGDSTGIHNSDFSVLHGLGRSYMDLRDFQTSEKYYHSAEKLFDKQVLTDRYIYCNNRGNLYYYWKRYDEALEWFRKALALVTPGHYEFHMQLTRLNLSDCFLQTGITDSAAYYAQSGEAFFNKIGHAAAIYYNTAVRAGIACKQGNMKLAGKLFKETSNPAGTDKNLVSIRNQFFIEYCTRTGAFKEAMKCMENTIAINDSLRTDYTLKRAATYDMQYKLDTSLLRKNVYITQQKAEIKSMKMRIVGMVAGGLLLIILTILAITAIRRKKDLQQLQFQRKLTQLRMQNIRNRISPHFVFNVLNGITGGQAAEERRDLLILLLRKSLELTDETLITLEQELEFVRLYIELEHFNLGDHFHFTCNVENGIDTMKQQIPPLLIQIPVENAIKHGLKSLTGEGEKKLAIDLSLDKKGIRISVTDNGLGLQHKSAACGTSTGSKVLFETINNLNQHCDEKISYNLTRSPEGTVAELWIPFSLNLL